MFGDFLWGCSSRPGSRWTWVGRLSGHWGLGTRVLRQRSPFSPQPATSFCACAIANFETKDGAITQVFAARRGTTWLSWDDTVALAEQLDLPTVAQQQVIECH